MCRRVSHPPSANASATRTRPIRSKDTKVDKDKRIPFLWSAPVAFRRVALETPERTSRDSNHHRQSVSAGKTNAIPTEPSGRLKNKRIPESGGAEAFSAVICCLCGFQGRAWPIGRLRSSGRVTNVQATARSPCSTAYDLSHRRAATFTSVDGSDLLSDDRSNIDPIHIHRC